MKKIYTYMMMVLMALPMLTLTSCDRDAADAHTLNGQWEGFISTYYVDRWGLTGEDYRTCIQFVQRDNYGGTGFEVDYDVRDRWGSYYYSCAMVLSEFAISTTMTMSRFLDIR